MTCDEACPLLAALIDGELAGDDAAALTAHLGLCPACRDRAEDYRLVQTHAAGAPIAADRQHALAVQLAVALDELSQLRAEVRALAAEVQAIGQPAQESRPRGLGIMTGGRQPAHWDSLGIV